MASNLPQHPIGQYHEGEYPQGAYDPGLTSEQPIGGDAYSNNIATNDYNNTSSTGPSTGAYTNGNVNSSPGAIAPSAAAMRQKRYDYGGNPLAREQTYDEERLQAFGGELQPGLFKGIKDRKLANPAPLGLSAFALTTFVLSLLNMGTRGQGTPNLVVALAYGYGGLVQLLAGMWEMAIGNTFGATALSSYGGFWISFAIIFTPGGFAIESAYAAGTTDFQTVFSFYLFGWFIFTFIMLMCTLKSTIAFFFLFFTLDLAFLMLALAYYYPTAAGGANVALNTAGGVFGILAAFAAWYNALAGLLEPTNSFFLIPVAHFPWSAKGREARGKDSIGTVLGHHPEDEKTE